MTLTQIRLLKLLCDLEDIGCIIVESFDAPGDVRRGLSLGLEPGADLSATGTRPTEHIDGFGEVHVVQAKLDG